MKTVPTGNILAVTLRAIGDDRLYPVIAVERKLLIDEVIPSPRGHWKLFRLKR